MFNLTLLREKMMPPENTLSEHTMLFPVEVLIACASLSPKNHFHARDGSLMAPKLIFMAGLVCDWQCFTDDCSSTTSKCLLAKDSSLPFSCIILRRLIKKLFGSSDNLLCFKGIFKFARQPDEI